MNVPGFERGRDSTLFALPLGQRDSATSLMAALLHCEPWQAISSSSSGQDVGHLQELRIKLLLVVSYLLKCCSGNLAFQ